MSTKGKEYKLAIRIAGIIDKSFTTSLAAANTSLKATLLSVDKDFTMLDKGFNKVAKMGQRCFSTIATAAGVATVAVGAATAASIAVGSEFESAFAGVKKTVDATEKEFERLRQDILDMSRVIPSSATEIAGVMEIAGQLGIANEYLTDFTETMIKLGVSTNMTAEDAATALAKFANITGMDPNDYERLGSVIVDLGNNFATTEEDIVQMATRLASTGDLVGLSEAQIMALSTAMSAVGIKAESGGSTMSKLLKKMQLAVETNSKSLKDYADVAGMTGQEFSDAFKKDAVVALSAFIGGLNDTERNGKSAIAILDEMGLKEVRLSNTILALAGSGDLMTEAITMANEAWGENTALTEEANRRYETAESQLQLMKNAAKELGIVAYEDLRGPFVDGIQVITDKIHDFTDYVDGPKGMGAWLEKIGTEMPTLQRKFKKYGEPVFNGITGAGKWIVKNGKTILSILSGVGTAMAGYKVASSGVHFITALMKLGSMNPVTLGILGVVGAIGALTGAIVAYKQYEAEIRDNSLAEHFGDIALSMEDIQQVAEHIIGSETLDGVRKALEAFGDLDTFSDTMENAIKSINKMNWKVSIGMKLSEDEQEQYKAAIDEYVQAAQEYVVQSQYAVSINLKAGFGDSAEGASIASKVEQFYKDSYDEMTSLGKSLSEAVNKAFADGVLDPGEVNTIADIQAKIAEVQQSLATGEFDAKLSMLGLDYAGGKQLTADSFMNLQSELNNQIAIASEAYKESYAKNYASVSAAHDGGKLTDAEFNTAIQALKDAYLQNISNLNLKSSTFQIDTIMGSYKGEMAGFKNNVDSVLTELMGSGRATPEDWRNGLYNAMYEVGSSVDKGERLALGELYNQLKPQLQQLKDLAAEYTEVGKAVPEEISTAIDNIFAIGAASGDEGAIWETFGRYFSENEEYATVIALAQEAGSCIPEEIIGAMTNEGVMADISENVDYILESIKTGLQEGVEITIPVYYELAHYGIQYKKSGVPASDININALNGWEDPINHRANGGLATRPELTWFAENGPEMAIPIDGSRNAISLWEKTGRLLGMSSVLDGVDLEGGGSSPSIQYNPTLQFYGEAPSKDDLTDALRISQDEFDSLMDRYFKNRGRVAFG